MLTLEKARNPLRNLIRARATILEAFPGVEPADVLELWEGIGELAEAKSIEDKVGKALALLDEVAEMTGSPHPEYVSQFFLDVPPDSPAYKWFLAAVDRQLKSNRELTETEWLAAAEGHIQWFYGDDDEAGQTAAEFVEAFPWEMVTNVAQIIAVLFRRTL